LRALSNIRLIIDDSVAARFGIPRTSLPSDAEIINESGGWRALSVADRRLLWAGAVLLLLQMITILVLIADFWLRKKAERELRESRETLSRAQRIARIGLWSRNPATGELTWSEEVYRIFGADPSSFKPSYETFLSLVHPADRSRVDAIVRSSDARRQSRVLEFRIQLPSGEERYVRSTGEWFTGPDGKPRVAGMVQDITEIKHTEELLRQMQRTEAVGTLAGGVAHDFNNLLTVINGYSQLLAGALDPSDPRFQHVREIQRAGERAAELTRQLLAFSRRQILSPRLFDLNQLVRDSVGLLKPVLGDSVRLELDLAGSLCLVHADPLQIEQVLINLAANARDAMPKGGCFRIRTATLLLTEFSGGAEEAIRPGRYVELTVSDTGIGMDEETRRRVFEPFFTTKPEGKGTGLGLASVYGVVRQSGGWIAVSSAPGLGTTFRILLPLAEGAVPPHPEPSQQRASATAKRVLVLDHHPPTSQLVGLALRQAGYQVEFAPDEDSLSRMMEAAPKNNPFRVLLVDLRMPHISGLELVRRLRSRYPHLRALMLFADPLQSGAPELQHGEAHIDAPVTPAAVIEAVRLLLAPNPAA
jgi:PAS domain S-box-containing protein